MNATHEPISLDSELAEETTPTVTHSILFPAGQAYIARPTDNCSACGKVVPLTETCVVRLGKVYCDTRACKPRGRGKR